MSIVNQNKLNACKYNLRVAIFVDDHYYDLDDRGINSLLIEKDFNGDFFPLINLDAFVTIDQYKLIMSRKNDILFRILLDMTYETIDTEKKENTKIRVFDGLYQPIIDNMTENPMESIAEPDLYKQDKVTPSTPLNVYLFNIDALKVNRTNLNFIAKECRVKDVIGYILNKANVGSALISLPNNIDKLSQVMIPPMNFKNAIEFLSETYGIYDTGMRHFFDVDGYYLVSNTQSRLPYSKNEYSNVYVNIIAPDDTSEFNVGSYTDHEAQCHILSTFNNIDIINDGVFIAETVGKNIKTFDRQRMESSVSFNEDGTFKVHDPFKKDTLDIDSLNGNERVNYFYNSNGVNSAIEDVRLTTNYSNTRFTLTFEMVDLNLFKLNKAFIFRFDDPLFKKYNGRYLLTHSAFAMENKSGASMCTCKFNKID